MTKLTLDQAKANFQECDHQLQLAWGNGDPAGIKAAMKRGAYGDLNANTSAEDNTVCEDMQPVNIELLPSGYSRRLSEGGQRRLEYFVDEDIAEMSDEERVRTMKAIRGSKWYKRVDVSDDRAIYNLFDDVKLGLVRGEPITREFVESLYN